jgi:hypothetical protein
MRFLVDEPGLAWQPGYAMKGMTFSRFMSKPAASVTM